MHNAGTVAHMKAFELLAARGEIQTSIGQHAVNVEHEESNVLRAFDQRVHLHHTRAQQIVNVQCADERAALVDDR